MGFGSNVPEQPMWLRWMWSVGWGQLTFWVFFPVVVVNGGVDRGGAGVPALAGLAGLVGLMAPVPVVIVATACVVRPAGMARKALLAATGLGAAGLCLFGFGSTSLEATMVLWGAFAAISYAATGFVFLPLWHRAWAAWTGRGAAEEPSVALLFTCALGGLGLSFAAHLLAVALSSGDPDRLELAIMMPLTYGIVLPVCGAACHGVAAWWLGTRP